MTISEDWRLGPGDFAFELATNEAIDAQRALDFLQLFVALQADGESSELLAVDILEISTGSLRGHLRCLFPKVESADRFRRVRLRYQNAIDKSAPVLRSSDNEAKTHRLARLGLNRQDLAIAISVAAIIAALAAAVISSDANSANACVVPLMQSDGVTRLTLATKGHQWVIDREDIPALLTVSSARESSETRAFALGSSSSNSGRNVVNSQEARRSRYGDRIIGEFTGTVTRYGGAYLLRDMDPQYRDIGEVILIPPHGLEYPDGYKATFKGDMTLLSGSGGVLQVEKNWPEGQPEYAPDKFVRTVLVGTVLIREGAVVAYFYPEQPVEGEWISPIAITDPPDLVNEGRYRMIGTVRMSEETNNFMFVDKAIKLDRS